MFGQYQAPHQLCWCDREMGTAISCTECSQVAGLIQKVVETSRKHHLFMQLSFILRSYIAIVIVDDCVLSTWTRPDLNKALDKKKNVLAYTRG